MRFFKITFFFFIYFTLMTYSHNPEDFIISEIEQGQILFENEQLSQEYNAAVKRLRIRKLTAMSLPKKLIIFIKAGFNHIIPKGLDHILFVLGLFFSSIYFRQLLLQVTAFTFAHSITLILAANGIINIQANIIEPLIAISIVWIAIENCLFKNPPKWRWMIVFFFGLLHGLGFASVLSNYGLPNKNFISLLLSFNIGVELGQISVLIIAFLLLKLFFRRKWNSEKLRLFMSICIAIIGAFWFIERIF